MSSGLAVPLASASALSRDSRILRASVIRNVVGQVFTRFSTSVSSVASAVLMGQSPSAASKMAVQGGRIRSQVRFEGENGAINGDSDGIVLGFSSESGGYLIVGLGAFGFAYSIWECVPGFAWINRKALGQMQNLRFNNDYQLQMAQRGQRISLVVDGVPVLEHVVPSPLPGNQLGLFTMSVEGQGDFDELVPVRHEICTPHRSAMV